MAYEQKFAIGEEKEEKHEKLETYCKFKSGSNHDI